MAKSGEIQPPTLEEVADLLRLVQFTLERSRTSLVANCRPQHVGFIERDVDRLTEMMAQVKAMLVRLPSEEPMTPEREKEMGTFLAAVLDKRFGDGSQEAVDQAARVLFAGDESGRPRCPRGEHVHKDGTRWPTGDSCGGDPAHIGSYAPPKEDT